MIFLRPHPQGNGSLFSSEDCQGPHFLLIRNLTRDGQYEIRSRRTK